MPPAAVPPGEAEHPLQVHPLQELPRREPVSSPARSASSSRHSRRPPARRRPRAPQAQNALQTQPLRLRRAPAPEQARDLDDADAADDADPLLGRARRETRDEPRSPPYATPLDEIFAEGTPPREGAGVDQRFAAGALEAEDICVLETVEDRERGVPAYVVRMPDLEGAEEWVYVRRALADFTWLERTLRERYQAAIVPALPPMALAGRVRYGYRYDEERRRGMEKFLRRVAAHAVLSTVDEFLAFLGVLGDEAWREVRNDVSPRQGVIAAALFGPRAEDGNVSAVQWLSRWSSYKMFQAGRRINKRLAAFLERDDPARDRRRENNAEARLARLKAYVDALEQSLATLRRAAARSTQARADHTRADDALDGVLVALGDREGRGFGKLLQSSRIASRFHPPYASMARSPDSAGSFPAAPRLLLPKTMHVGQSGVPGAASPPTLDANGNFLRKSLGAGETTGVELGGAAAAGLASIPAMAVDSPGRLSRNTSQGDFMAGGGDDSMASSTSALDIPILGSQMMGDARLEEVLQEFELRAQGAKRIMGARLDEQEAYEHASEVYRKLRDKMEAQTGSMWASSQDESTLELARGRGVEELYRAMTAAATNLADARKQYEEIANATNDELWRLRGDMHVEVAQALGNVARENAHHHAARAAAWSSLANQCDLYSAGAIRATGSTSRFPARSRASVASSGAAQTPVDTPGYSGEFPRQK